MHSFKDLSTVNRKPSTKEYGYTPAIIVIAEEVSDYTAEDITNLHLCKELDVSPLSTDAIYPTYVHPLRLDLTAPANLLDYLTYFDHSATFTNHYSFCETVHASTSLVSAMFHHLVPSDVSHVIVQVCPLSKLSGHVVHLSYKTEKPSNTVLTKLIVDDIERRVLTHIMPAAGNMHVRV